MKKFSRYKRIKVEMSQKDFFDMVVEKNNNDVREFRNKSLVEGEHRYRYKAIRVEIEYTDGSHAEGHQLDSEPWMHNAIMYPEKKVKEVVVINQSTRIVIARLSFK